MEPRERTFDAAKLSYTGSNWSLEAFGASVVNVYADGINESDLTNNTGRDQFLGGLYSAPRRPISGQLTSKPCIWTKIRRRATPVLSPSAPA